LIAALFLAAAVPPVEATERAFASAAQTKGQWTAFREFAAPDAQMLLDGPQPAAPFLKDRANPPVAVMWWPARTITSCDGSLAFSTGPWIRKGGHSSGRYFTIWRHDNSGWRWIFDGGAQDHAATAAGDKVVATHASCGAGLPVAATDDAVGGGASRDGSLRWSLVKAGGDGFTLVVSYRAGRNWKTESAVVG
jgi:hypothetical protein